MNQIGTSLVLLGVLLFIVAFRLMRKRATRIPTNLRVVVTGASSGIGAEIARQYARKGARLVLAARREEELQKVATDCRRLGSGSIEICVTDVTNPADCEKLAQTAALKFNGQVDVLVLNAGIGMRGLVEGITDVGIYKKLMDTNYLGCVYVTHYMLRLVKNASGRIVVVSSISGRLGVPNMAGYCGSKHALHGFFDALRNEGHRVTIVCPGFVATDMPKKNLSATGGAVGDSDTVDRGHPMPVDTAAQLIMQAAARGEREVVFDRLASWAVYLRTLLPNVIDAQLQRRMRRQKH